MDNRKLEQTEVNLLLEAMYQRYGFDLRSYARASLNRRLRHFLAMSDCNSIAELIPRTLHDEAFFSHLTQTVAVSVTEMFRDPSVHLALREQVLPVLRTWPYFKVWHAGCPTGEEVYSLAIMLREEGLLDRATIYATDYNDASLAAAKQGIYDADRIQKFTKSYQAAGGTRSFSDYYHAHYDSAVLSAGLRRRITFANHNLAVDHSFGEMHLILCRNVMIYFDNDLQSRVLRILTESLAHGGFLCLGTKETLRFSEVAAQFVEVDSKARIYKKLGMP